jgi:hypothetical protein
MPSHKLTFELSAAGDELFVHADVAGLRFLSQQLTQLASQAEKGRKEHVHLMTEEWAGNELTSAQQDAESTLLNKVNIHAWPAGK